MGYDWKKIFKNKSDKELYQIYQGKAHLGDEARLYAEEELKIREFDFNNINKHKKKWELEYLIQEEREENKHFTPGVTKAKHFLLIGILGILFALINILEAFSDVSSKSSLNYDDLNKIFLPIIGLTMGIMGFVRYRNRIKREKYRASKMKEIIKQL